MKKSDSLLYQLTIKETIIIFTYYFIILLAGMLISIHIICNIAEDKNNQQLITTTIKASLSVSGIFCSMKYIKRLYKACITNRIICKSTTIGRLGNIMYFIFRPFYSFAFVIIMIFALLSQMFIVTGSFDNIINERFLYLCIISSSFIGYSIGNLIDKFEDISNKKINNYQEVHNG